MLSFEMLPAAHGDCLWIEYGDAASVRRILIDGGPGHTYPALRERILRLPSAAREFELLVVTHIDADHIEGIVRLLQDADALQCRFQRIWFNGRPQLASVPDPAGPELGAEQGEMLGLLIADLEKRSGTKVWNRDLENGIAMVARNAASLPRIVLPGDCALTLLSPDAQRLLELKTQWKKVLQQERWPIGDDAHVRNELAKARQLKPIGPVLGAGSDADAVDPARFELPDPFGRDVASDGNGTLGGGEPGEAAVFGSDPSLPNGSSIALLLEYPAREPTVRLLLAGDAWPSVLETSIDALLRARGAAALALDVLKLPHHGSVANVSESLLHKLRCRDYWISTSGAVFRHPHARAVELVIASHRAPGKPRLCFNYASETTRKWGTGVSKHAAEFPKGVSRSW